MDAILTPEEKAFIDSQSLQELLHRWRFSPLSGTEPLFQGDTGDYYKKVMFDKRDADPDAWTAASKRIGW